MDDHVNHGEQESHLRGGGRVTGSRGPRLDRDFRDPSHRNCFVGLAWWAVAGGRAAPAGTWIFIWGRVMRDCGSEVLPLSQIGGYVLGARAITLHGVSGLAAAATTVVDVTLELCAQLAYTALGLALLLQLPIGAKFAVPGSIGLAIAIAGSGDLCWRKCAVPTSLIASVPSWRGIGWARSRRPRAHSRVRFGELTRAALEFGLAFLCILPPGSASGARFAVEQTFREERHCIPGTQRAAVWITAFALAESAICPSWRSISRSVHRD
jgi:hypothetical protein